MRRRDSGDEMIDIEEVKSRINPAYSDTRGTESYERKMLVEEIERLQKVASAAQALLEYGANGKLAACERERDELSERVGWCNTELNDKDKRLAACEKALGVADEGRSYANELLTQKAQELAACDAAIDVVAKETK